jgi:TetR/AcrR family transcriptional repressor of mexJK operon
MTERKPAGVTRSGCKHASILAAAEELFLQQGFERTSMDEVAALAGVSKQTVYAQFSGKVSLFTAVSLGMTKAAADAVQQNLDDMPPGSTLAAHLTAYAIRQLEVVRTPKLMQLRRLAIAETPRFPDLGKALHDGGPARAIASFAAAFARWHAQGLLQAPDAQVAATHFNWLIMAEPVNRAMLLGDAAVPAPAELQRHAAEAVRIFLAAYGARAA